MLPFLTQQCSTKFVQLFHYINPYINLCWTFKVICLLLNLWIFFTVERMRFFAYLSACCWTFKLSLLLNLWDYLLLLNLWIFFTAEPLRLCSGLCICLLLNLWILFTAEPLKLSVCFWTFGFSLLLNLWIFFTAEHLRLCPGLCICLMLKLWERSAVNKITKKVDP